MTDFISQIRTQIPAPRSISELIDTVRSQLKGQVSCDINDYASNGLERVLGGSNLEILDLLGEGAFGKVFRGLWRGTPVAIKTMELPNNSSGLEKRERMAIMEAAISSALSHPNIVQVFGDS